MNNNRKTTISVPIGKVKLDLKNPRHEYFNTQSEVIDYLVKNEGILNLAKDIAEQERLSPLEIVGLLYDQANDEYIPLEGNRRICSLILLNNPDLCKEQKHIKYLKNLSSQHSIPNTIDGFIFESREDADHWISLRHSGQQEGIGIRTWTAPQKTRYQQRKGATDQNAQTIEMLDFAIKNKLIKKDDINNIKITTMQRYLNNPVVRNLFGLSGRSGLITRQNQDNFTLLVKRFISDALNKDNNPTALSSRSKKVDWEEYANALSHQVCMPPLPDAPAVNMGVDNSATQPSKSTTSTTSTTPPAVAQDHKLEMLNNTKQPSTNNPQQTANEGSAKPSNGKKSTKQDPNKRKFLIPSSTSFPIKNNVHNRLYWEIKGTEVEGHEFAVAFLMRAFIEAMATAYLKKHNPGILGNQKIDLNTKIKKVHEHLKQDSSINPKDIRSLAIAADNKNSIMSPLSLGNMIHLTVVPTKRELLQMWDNYEPALLILNQKSS